MKALVAGGGGFIGSRLVRVFEPPAKGEIHVEDVVKAFVLATLNRKAYGQVFNAACEPSVLTRKIRETLGWKPKFIEA
ncbi:MAG: hypothetical protein QHH12_00275 [Candidatus Bathyarchaeota archaeon]|jgi:nucleoside-diphosphate-sugar epimerase|nr:hypothetical protein [Candidatus Bathyarchaeota archaeon A05DMB-3]MDH7606193.1 hypothetical protein [Candidatus Bathyarchaeota archaeon]